MIGDLMKFEILYHFGLYMDTNIELLRDPTELFTVAASLKKEVFLVADPGGDKRFASAGFMGALKKHSPLFASLIANEQYLNEIPFEEHCVANAWTGPMFLTLKVLHFDSAVILDRDTAYPLLCGQDQKDRCLERVGNDETTGSKVDKKHSVLVKEENGDMWRVKVPCNDLAREYPEATAVDHFSLGKSWINCKPAARSQKLVDWTLRYVHDPASFIFDFTLDQVRWSGAHNTEKLTKKLVKRRQQLLGAGSNRAQLIILATTARSGGTLLSELLRQSFDADEDTVVWQDEGGLHSDIPLYNRFFDLGDLWSEVTLNQDWVKKDLKPKLLGFGVEESSFDHMLEQPALFVDEVLQKTASAGYQYVLVKVGWNVDPTDALLSKRVASNLMDSFPHANVIFLERAQHPRAVRVSGWGAGHRGVDEILGRVQRGGLADAATSAQGDVQLPAVQGDVRPATRLDYVFPRRDGEEAEEIRAPRVRGAPQHPGQAGGDDGEAQGFFRVRDQRQSELPAVFREVDEVGVGAARGPVPQPGGNPGASHARLPLARGGLLVDPLASI